MNEENGLSLLKEFAKAWSSHDVEALMACMTDDPIYYAAAGTYDEASGKKYEGVEAVRDAYSSIWAIYPDAKWSEHVHFVQANRGISEWLFTATGTNGQQVCVNGVDTFYLNNGKIAVKNTYRKQQS
jgi:hypothetical protein